MSVAATGHARMYTSIQKDTYHSNSNVLFPQIVLDYIYCYILVCVQVTENELVCYFLSLLMPILPVVSVHSCP